MDIQLYDALQSFSSSKKARLETNIDADDPLDSDSDDSDSDDDDDTALLMAELQKIKEEKAMEEQEKVQPTLVLRYLLIWMSILISF